MHVYLCPLLVGEFYICCYAQGLNILPSAYFQTKYCYRYVTKRPTIITYMTRPATKCLVNLVSGTSDDVGMVMMRITLDDVDIVMKRITLIT